MDREMKAIGRQIIDTCLKLTEIGFVYGTWGNISVRYGKNMLITPSRIPYAEMKPGDIVLVNLESSECTGLHTASSEKELHRQLYLKRNDINAIIHCHSAYATMASATGDGIPAITEEMCQLIGGSIPVSHHFVPSSMHLELGRVVADAINNKNAVLIRNHGSVGCGGNLGEAFVTCQVVEKAARIWSVFNKKEPSVIEDKWVLEGRDYYLKRYGKEN